MGVIDGRQWRRQRIEALEAARNDPAMSDPAQRQAMEDELAALRADQREGRRRLGWHILAGWGRHPG